MRVRFRFLGLIQENDLSHNEKRQVVEIINSYNYTHKERKVVLHNLRTIIKASGNFEEVKHTLIYTMGVRFTRNWQRTSKVLVFEKKFWDWLLSKGSGVGFDQTTLENYSRSNGLIGVFDGVECYVREAMNVKQGLYRTRVQNNRH